MGFFDKLKDAGKKAGEGALLMAEYQCATVSSGKHEGCKVSVHKSEPILRFIRIAKLEEDMPISNIKTVKVISYNVDADSWSFELVYQDDNTSHIHLSMEYQMGSNLPTAEKRLAAKYMHATAIVTALGKNIPNLPEETVRIFNWILRIGNKPEL